NERTVIASFAPLNGYGDTWLLMFVRNDLKLLSLCLLSDQDSLVHDYISRQKVGGVHLKYHYKKQLVNLTPDQVRKSMPMIVNKVIELVYTSWDIKAFADDIWKEADA